MKPKNIEGSKKTRHKRSYAVYFCLTRKDKHMKRERRKEVPWAGGGNRDEL